MPYTTTRVDKLVTENYPFGHAVNTVADNVCWNLAIPEERRARKLVSLNRTWVEIADRGAPGDDHPRCGVSAISTGARQATGTHLGRSSASGKGARVASGYKRKLELPVQTHSRADLVETTYKRNANSAQVSKLVDLAFISMSMVQANRIRTSRITMNTNRRNADKEKARSANSGPSRNSMSVVVVGTRSDSRQTA